MQGAFNLKTFVRQQLRMKYGEDITSTVQVSQKPGAPPPEYKSNMGDITAPHETGYPTPTQQVRFEEPVKDNPNNQKGAGVNGMHD